MNDEKGAMDLEESRKDMWEVWRDEPEGRDAIIKTQSQTGNNKGQESQSGLVVHACFLNYPRG